MYHDPSDLGSLILIQFIPMEHMIDQCQGQAGEYLPEVVVIGTEHNKVCTKKHSRHNISQARLVSSLLYGIKIYRL